MTLAFYAGKEKNKHGFLSAPDLAGSMANDTLLGGFPLSGMPGKAANTDARNINAHREVTMERNPQHRLAWATLALGLLACLPQANAQRATYQALIMPGSAASQAYGINASGDVVGYFTSGGVQHAFLYSGGAMQDIGTLGGSSSYAYGINATGQVVGYSHTTGNTALHAFLYSGGAMQDLGTLGGSSSKAYAINDVGQVVGYSDIAGCCEHAFLYSGATMQDLGTLGGSNSSNAYGINATGQVTGFSYTSGGTSPDAFLYSGGTMQDLGTLGGGFSTAYGINGIGQVVGYSLTADAAYTEHAFLYSGGTMQDIGTLGGNFSRAYGINNSSQVVGRAAPMYGPDRAFLWNAGTMFDLGATEARAINDLAQIAGTAAVGASTEAFRLTLHPDWQGGGGYWTDASRWNFAGMGSFGIVPGAPHDVVIAPDYDGTVYGPANANVNSLSLLGGTLNLNGGHIVTATGTALWGELTVLTGNGRLTGGLELIRSQVQLGHSQHMVLDGNVNIGSLGQINVSGVGSSIEVNGDLINDGMVDVIAGSAIEFHGTVRGTGSFYGGGMKTFAGGYAPGASPGQVTMSGNIVFSGGTLTMELGGLTPGTGHDQIIFLGPVTLGGTALNVEYWAGWTAGAGDIYDLFDWNGGLTGTFAGVTLPALASGLVWNTSGLYTTGEISVAAVPEPSAYAMFLAGLGLLGFMARRRVTPLRGV